MFDLSEKLFLKVLGEKRVCQFCGNKFSSGEICDFKINENGTVTVSFEVFCEEQPCDNDDNAVAKITFSIEEIKIINS